MQAMLNVVRPLRCWAAVICCLACVAASSVNARAADYKNTTQPIELAICSDVNLARQNREIAEALASDERAMPPGLRESLQRGQEKWLRLRDVACNTEGVDVGCLRSVLGQRVSELTARPASKALPAATFLNPPILKGFPYSGPTADVDVERLLDLHLDLANPVWEVA